jgi:hypothetical protein
MAFRDSSHNMAASTSVAIAASSLDIVENDILLAFGAYWRDGVAWGDFNLPSGFTELEVNELAFGGTCKVGWKRASSSESGNYIFSNDYADEIYAIIASFSGRVESGSPVDAIANTQYETNNATVRGAGVTIATAGSDLIWCGISATGASPELAAPSGMTSRDSYDTDSGVSMELASLDNQSTGATGDKDGTANASTDWKHAFLLALKPAAAASGNPYYAYAQQ